MTNYNKLAIWEEEDEEQIGYLRKPTWLYYTECLVSEWKQVPETFGHLYWN